MGSKKKKKKERKKQVNKLKYPPQKSMTITGNPVNF